MIDPLGKLREHQDGRCAICVQDRTLVVDHDHATGLVRGLLCSACNSSEGKGFDYPWMVQYRTNPPAAQLGLVVQYGEHLPRRERPPRKRAPKRTLLHRWTAHIAKRGMPPIPEGVEPAGWQAECEKVCSALVEFERDVARERAAEERLRRQARKIEPQPS